MKIGIIGSSGEIGSMIYEFLYLCRMQTIRFARQMDPEIEYFDVLDIERPLNFCNFDLVIYCSWATKNRTQKSQAEHAQAAGHWAKVAQRDNCRFIFISTVLSGQNAKSNYGTYKYMAETMIEKYGGKSLRLGLVADDAYDLLLTRLRRLDRKHPRIHKFFDFQIYAVSSTYFLRVLKHLLSDWPEGSVFWVAPVHTESLSNLMRNKGANSAYTSTSFKFPARLISWIPVTRGSIGTIVDGVKGVLNQNSIRSDSRIILEPMNSTEEWYSNLFL